MAEWMRRRNASTSGVRILMLVRTGRPPVVCGAPNELSLSNAILAGTAFSTLRAQSLHHLTDNGIGPDLQGSLIFRNGFGAAAGSLFQCIAEVDVRLHQIGCDAQ